MLSEEHIISLIVECSDPASFKIGLLEKQRSQHSSNTLTQPRVEIVKNNFWIVRSNSTMTLKWSKTMKVFR
jgi:hypothetical protein